MSRCLDEATLQSYFDGELSGKLMESATSHLASCSACAAAARELEQELSLLTTALAAEFDENVPTERLRQRIDAAVLDARLGAASAPQTSTFGAFVSNLLNFGSQRTLAYASLVVLLAFAALFALVKMRTPAPAPPTVAQTTPVQNPAQNVVVTQPAPIVSPNAERVQVRIATPRKSTDSVYRPVKVTNRDNATAKTATPTVEPVKLLPGERSYLQTIARLDSTIKSNQKNMRPSLQVEYERNLAVVDRAIAATRSAAKRNPQDPDAADFMFAAYQSKVDLLNTIADARLGGGRSH